MTIKSEVRQKFILEIGRKFDQLATVSGLQEDKLVINQIEQMYNEHIAANYQERKIPSIPNFDKELELIESAMQIESAKQTNQEKSIKIKAASIDQMLLSLESLFVETGNKKVFEVIEILIKSQIN